MQYKNSYIIERIENKYNFFTVFLWGLQSWKSQDPVLQTALVTG